MNDQGVVDRLRASLTAQNAGDFEDALQETVRRGLARSVIDLLVGALLMHWHTRHEDLALTLQDLRDPAAVDALYAAALTHHDYLAFDDNFALARKCTWALADIGTPAAQQRLRELARCENPTIVAFAQRRLDRWEQEHAPHRT